MTTLMQQDGLSTANDINTQKRAGWTKAVHPLTFAWLGISALEILLNQFAEKYALFCRNA